MADVVTLWKSQVEIAGTFMGSKPKKDAEGKVKSETARIWVDQVGDLGNALDVAEFPVGHTYAKGQAIRLVATVAFYLIDGRPVASCKFVALLNPERVSTKAS